MTRAVKEVKAGDEVSGEVTARGKVAGEGLADVREWTMQMFSGRALQTDGTHKSYMIQITIVSLICKMTIMALICKAFC